MTTKDLICFIAIGFIVGIVFQRMDGAKEQQSKTTYPIECTQHIMVDGMPYCGVQRVNGILYEVTMKDVEDSEEIRQ